MSLVVGSAMVLLGAAAFLLLGRGSTTGSVTPSTDSGAPAQPSWPVALNYQLRFREFSLEVQPALTLAAFELVADRWQAWRQVRTCCGQMAGQVIEFRPDGTLWEGGVLGLPITHSSTQEPGEGMVPLPDFAARFPDTRADLEATPLVTITGDSATGIDQDGGLQALLDIAGTLGLEPDELIAYDIASGPTRSRRVVLLPLNLTLLSQEWHEDGLLLRDLRVNRIDLDASPPFA